MRWDLLHNKKLIETKNIVRIEKKEIQFEQVTSRKIT